MSAELPSSTTVLVVGAGPAGLATALTLAKAGLEVTIVDAAPQNPSGSRAMAVHANTLEVLSTIGASEQLTNVGIKMGTGTFYDKETPIFNIEANKALTGKTPYPFVLLIPQQETERILGELLSQEGVSVLRGNKVVGYENGEDGVDVSFESGEKVRAKYVVGADGTRSKIRESAGIEYKDPNTGDLYSSPPKLGTKGTARLVLADVYLAEPRPPFVRRDRMTVQFFGGISAFYVPLNPLPGDDGDAESLYRFITFLRDDEKEDVPQYPGEEYLQRLIDGRNSSAIPVRVTKVTHASRYRVRSAVANTFFASAGSDAKGKVFLVGDAAHCHSPAGGQGMNLGLCDAVSLAKAIASHSNSQNSTTTDDSDSIFREWATHRRKIALEVVGLAEGLTTLNEMSTGWRRVVRTSLLAILGWFPGIMGMVMWRMSGLVYRDPILQKEVSAKDR